ncbi:SIMPL domain-containing protein [Microbacterium fluvii]|uniref:SIMPL domain-containing protein n=1 Tax=Microbacterium fluvii TaxID=415215 RepID=A0ABW2HFK5_9MICO|nr:SIMPL domain-containing protein [Microbacterium fluvii]MCU4672182.1 SIMPL domain-containing protein [Microbacterium fluvii]
MSDVIITVRGEREHRVAPEQAVARIVVRADGPDRGEVVERMTAAATVLRDDLTARKTAGGIADWSSRRVSVWADRPWNAEGKRLAPVHRASVEITATFTDFTALSWWLSEISDRDEVAVEEVSWELTPETARRVEADVAASAVQVAVARATAYAAAIGLTTVVPEQIADLGLLSSGGAETAAPRMMKAAMMSDAGGSGAPFAFEPEEITVTAAVEARFRAR